MTDHADASLQNAVRELLEDMNRQHSSNTDSDSDLRWTLEKKVETDPSCGAGLVRVLVAELEQRLRRMSEVDETSAYVHVIPLLHTLHSVVVQSGAAVPAGLLQDVLSCLRRTLSLPLPYSAVAKRTLRSIRTEETKPGSLCLRRVTAEQNLMQEQERVFVLAEPAVFSAPLEASVKRFLESDALEDAAEVQRVLVLRVLHKALGSTCQSSRVAQALQALDDRALEQTFQDVTAAAEQGFGTGGRAAYVDTLERIQEELLTAWTQDAPTGSDGSPPAAMPPPRISFYRWNDEKQLSKLLEKFTLLSSAGVDREENKTGDLSASRRSPPRRLTARVVLMGDDRALGRLARAYLALRKRESKRLKLTKKLNIEFYYVPVTAVEPWHRSPPQSERRENISGPFPGKSGSMVQVQHRQPGSDRLLAPCGVSPSAGHSVLLPALWDAAGQPARLFCEGEFTTAAPVSRCAAVTPAWRTCSCPSWRQRCRSSDTSNTNQNRPLGSRADKRWPRLEA
ncbi:phosphoinositide 3-kinase regulatory subunit 6 isoform X5 [Betta splendens]|uniref:Phosphoinositide 3-kinase regulatory subunit 6 isoform X5 n=1 Tax=Betta splendens TaxID=158456 RepID=A0A9W2XXM5_BETSP|nr:phosphoinositide 3-kinase regulatory subunit 6 isoform X5 [Betta splendens]